MSNALNALREFIVNSDANILYENMRRKCNDYSTFVPRFKTISEGIGCLPKEIRNVLGFLMCGKNMSISDFFKMFGEDLFSLFLEKGLLRTFKQEMWLDGFVFVCYENKVFLINCPNDYENYNSNLHFKDIEGTMKFLVNQIKLYRGKKVLDLFDDFGIVSSVMADDNDIVMYYTNPLAKEIMKINLLLNNVYNKVKFHENEKNILGDFDLIIALPDTDIIPARIDSPYPMRGGDLGMDCVIKVLGLVEKNLVSEGEMILAGMTVADQGGKEFSNVVKEVSGKYKSMVCYQDGVTINTYIDVYREVMNRFKKTNKEISFQEWATCFGKYSNGKLVNFLFQLKKMKGCQTEIDYCNDWYRNDVPQTIFAGVREQSTKYILYNEEGRGIEVSADVYQLISRIDGKKTVNQILAQDGDMEISKDMFREEKFVSLLIQMQKIGLVHKRCLESIKI